MKKEDIKTLVSAYVMGFIPGLDALPANLRQKVVDFLQDNVPKCMTTEREAQIRAFGPGGRPTRPGDVLVEYDGHSGLRMKGGGALAWTSKTETDWASFASIGTSSNGSSSTASNDARASSSDSCTANTPARRTADGRYELRDTNEKQKEAKPLVGAKAGKADGAEAVQAKTGEYEGRRSKKVAAPEEEYSRVQQGHAGPPSSSRRRPTDSKREAGSPAKLPQNGQASKAAAHLSNSTRSAKTRPTVNADARVPADEADVSGDAASTLMPPPPPPPPSRKEPGKKLKGKVKEPNKLRKQDGNITQAKQLGGGDEVLHRTEPEKVRKAPRLTAPPKRTGPLSPDPLNSSLTHISASVIGSPSGKSWSRKSPTKGWPSRSSSLESGPVGSIGGYEGWQTFRKVSSSSSTAPLSRTED